MLVGVEISAPSKNISGKGWQPAYYLGSAESPTADFPPGLAKELAFRSS